MSLPIKSNGVSVYQRFDFLFLFSISTLVKIYRQSKIFFTDINYHNLEYSKKGYPCNHFNSIFYLFIFYIEKLLAIIFVLVI